MTQESKSDFGALRSFFWPIHGFEIKKILPMFMMMFFISFNYTILRDTKDALVVTAAGSGAEAIPFLKVWGVVPCAVIFMVIYAKLSNTLSKERLFYVTIAPFILFFALFPLLIYPNRELLHPHASADLIQSYLPSGFSGLIAVYRNWTYSIFFIGAELWGSAVLSLMFWGFANDITRVTEAKRFYTLFTLGANLALMVSGPAIIYFSNIRATLPEGADAWQVTLYYLMGMVVVSGLCISALYWWMQRNVLTDPRFYDPKEVKKKKEKPKMSLFESFAFLAKSKYILCIALLVIGYGMCINMVEVTWKGQLKLQFPNPNDYSAFMGKLSFFTGFVTVAMVFIGGFIIRRMGWGFAALTTPVVLLVTSIMFFVFVIFRENLTAYIAMLGTTPLFLAVLIGMVQNIMSKSTKYSLFDPTKEMAYIPLDQESKVKGKAAIDVVGARLGKSGGALIQQILIIGLGGIAYITPYVAVCVVGVIIAWIYAARSLNIQFLALSSGTQEPVEKEPATAPTAAAPVAT